MFILKAILGVLSFAAILYCIREYLSRSLRGSRIVAERKFELMQALSDRLIFVDKSNSALSDSVEREYNIYEVTKELSKFTEEDSMFEAFKEKICSIFKLADCVYLDGRQAPGEFLGNSAYSVFNINVPGQTTKYRALAVGDRGNIDKVKMSVMIAQLELSLRRAGLYREIEELSITDSLTEVFNRRYFLERLRQELLRSEHNGLNLSVLVIDLDYFKKYNDTFGHITGDMLLKEVASIFKASLRQIDMCARIGGEEFCIMLPETNKDGAFLVAERLRVNVEQAQIRAFNEKLKATISLGISCYPQDAQKPDTLIDVADNALYRAKKAGRNQTCIYGLKSG